MPSPPPEAIAPSSASFVKGYAKRASDQPPFASLLSRLTDHATFQDRPAALTTVQAHPDDPSRRFDAGTVHAPASRDSASTAGARPANAANSGSELRSNQPNAAPHAVATGESVDRTAKDTPAREGSTKLPGAASSTAATPAPSTQGPATTAVTGMTGMQAIGAAPLSLTSGGDTTGAASVVMGDNVFAIAGAKAPPSDLAPRLAPAAVAAGQAGAAAPVEQVGDTKDMPAREGSAKLPGATSSTATTTAPSTQGPATPAATDMTGMQAIAATLLSLTGGGDTTVAASIVTGDDVFAIAGAKAPSSDLAPRRAPAAVAAGPAGATAPVEQVGNAAMAGSTGAAEDADGDAAASAAPPNAGAATQGQLAEPPAVGTDPTDTATKSGSGRLAEDGGGVIADHPHATDAPANPTVNAAASVPSASPGPSATAPASNRAGGVPLSGIAITIAGQARAGKSRFDIRLDPPELGRIDVQLNVDRSGNVSSQLVVERPETLDLLRREAPQLERALQDAGLNTGSGMQFSLADQGFTSRNGLADYSVRPPLAAAADEQAAAAWMENVAAAGRGGGGGGLDITV